MDYKIILNNKKIWEFYNEHKNIDIENINLLFIDILDKIYTDSETTLNAGIAKQLLENVRVIQNQMSVFSESISKLQSEINMNFVMKFTDFKRDYMEDLKILLNNNAAEKISPLFEKYNEILQDKTKIFINEIIPKNQEVLKKDIITNMRTLQENLDKEFELIQNQQINPELLSKFLSNIDDKFSKTIINSQNVLNTFISSSEQRITSKIGEVKDITSTNNSTQSQLYTNLSEMLKKLENSSSKGRVSENLLYNIIQSLYPIAQIEYVAGAKESGDISLIRRDKSTILFENKNYDVNVGKTEIEKFYRDVDIQNCNGILLSQKSAIVNKNNYEIEIYNGKIVLFLHYVNYDPDKIKTAVDIIDHFQEKMNEAIVEGVDAENLDISKSFLEEINMEYQDFATNKMNYVKTLKEYNQKLLLQVENMRMPKLENLLNKHFSNSLASKTYICDYCGYKAKNSRALTAHLRGCGENKKDKRNLINLAET